MLEYYQLVALTFPWDTSNLKMEPIHMKLLITEILEEVRKGDR